MWRVTGRASARFSGMTDAEQKLARRFEAGAQNGTGEIVEVVQLWGDSMVGLAHFGPRETVVVGESAGCAFHAAGAPFPLVEREGARAWVLFPADAGVQLESRRAMCFEEILGADGERARAELVAGVRVRVTLGAITFLVQRVEHVDALRTPWRATLDAGFLSVLATVSLLVLGGALGLSLLSFFGVVPADSRDITRAEPLPFTRTISATPPHPFARAAPGGIPEAGAGARAAGDEGTRGVPESRYRARGGRSASADAAPNDATGIHDALDGAVADALAALGASTRPSSGGNAVAGALDALVRGHAHGSLGGGIRGNGTGGGGERIDAGGGASGGRGHGENGEGRDSGRWARDTGEPDFTVDSSDEVTISSLDPSRVDAAIRKQLARIQWCYERALPRDPSLAGKIVVAFRIGPDGRAADTRVETSTLHDGDVERCVVERFSSIPFPSPKGGGSVSVHYPLLFKSSGA